MVRGEILRIKVFKWCLNHFQLSTETIPNSAFPSSQLTNGSFLVFYTSSSSLPPLNDGMYQFFILLIHIHSLSDLICCQVLNKNPQISVLPWIKLVYLKCPNSTY